MEEYKISLRSKKIILALGAESAGNFSVFLNGTIYLSQDFGNLLEAQKFNTFKKALGKFLKDKNIEPSIILSDLHPNFLTTELAAKYAKRYKAKHIQVQHHLAHVFSAIGDEIICTPKKLKNYNTKSCLGIACDGTGYGLDEKIWGGEIFKIQNTINNIECTRLGHLENQILLGGELAIKEPARLIISIINKFSISNFQFPINSPFSNVKNQKELARILTKNFYSNNDFELLWNQLQQEFNCLETSSTARILDAVSVLLGFSKNESLSKHGPIKFLEENSTNPYLDLKPKIENYKLQDTNSKQISKSKNQITNETIVLNTTYLFEYLVKNIHKDKKRLAATAQKYIADGLLEITQQSPLISHQSSNIYFAGGMANNKIIADFLSSHGVYINKKIPRGDAGISLGQTFYYLANARD